LFFTDLEGYVFQPELQRSLRELQRLNPFVKILGSYPAGRTNVVSSYVGHA